MSGAPSLVRRPAVLSSSAGAGRALPRGCSGPSPYLKLERSTILVGGHDGHRVPDRADPVRFALRVLGIDGALDRLAPGGAVRADVQRPDGRARRPADGRDGGRGRSDGHPRNLGRPRCAPDRGIPSADHAADARVLEGDRRDRKSTRLNSSHITISYAVFCLKKKKKKKIKKPIKKKKKKKN